MSVKFDDYFNEQMKDPEFAEEYNKLQPEYALIDSLAKARKSQNLTQAELSARTGIAQVEISKIESGARNPSIKVLQKIADGMGMTLKVSFVPKDQIHTAH